MALQIFKYLATFVLGIAFDSVICCYVYTKLRKLDKLRLVADYERQLDDLRSAHIRQIAKVDQLYQENVRVFYRK